MALRNIRGVMKKQPLFSNLVSSFVCSIFAFFFLLCWYTSRSHRGLLGKPGFEPQARRKNQIQKVFLRRFSLSRFLAKSLRVNKIAMKGFSKKLSFGVDFKL